MKRTLLLLLCSILLCVSCDQKEIYRKIDDNFSQNRWDQKDSKTYAFTITDETKPYTIFFLFSHVYDYQFDQVPMDFKIIDPSGKEEIISNSIKIKDANGKQLADCGGDFCDLKQLLKEKVSLQKGEYKIIVTQRFKGPYLPNVLGVGIEVEVAK